MRLAERVAAGECVALAGDRIPVEGGALATASFLGAPARFPVGPYVIAALLDCPLYFLCSVREGDGYAIRFQLLAKRPACARRAPGAAGRLR